MGRMRRALSLDFIGCCWELTKGFSGGLTSYLCFKKIVLMEVEKMDCVNLSISCTALPLPTLPGSLSLSTFCKE